MRLHRNLLRRNHFRYARVFYIIISERITFCVRVCARVCAHGKANAYPLPQTRTDRYRNSIIPWGLFNWQ